MAKVYESETGKINIALAGDTMLTRRMSVFREKPFLELVEILRGADCLFANLEGSVRTWKEGRPGITQGTYMTTPPQYLEDLKWLGIDIVSCANNHAFDYGEGGVMATIGHLDRAGIAHAGSGQNLAEARSPGYVDTPNGRVGLVATTATYKEWNRAGAQRADVIGRPGINPFGHKTTYTIDPDSFNTLQYLNEKLGFEKATARDRRHFFSERDIPNAEKNEVNFLNQTFFKGNNFSIKSKCDETDVLENLRAIREARRMADWVIVSFHSHEFGGQSAMTAGSRAELEELGEFATDFARRSIDEGADIFVGHGAHTPLGIEIYKGKPILYSVGNFIFQNETVPFFPDEAYRRFDLPPEATPADFLDARTEGDTKGHPASPGFWENIIVFCRFKNRKPFEILIYPIDQGFGRPRAQRGRPVLAQKEISKKILERMKRLSERYGTKLTIEKNIGRISL